MNPEIEGCIRKNITWSKLHPHVKQLLGNSQREYEKKVLDYSIKNQLRYRGNLVRLVRKDEKGYYEELLRFSREHLMLFPYHLSDFIVTAMRITPFQYYISVMQDLMEQERSYDSLPNFTAADCLRLLGIGRNQYIDLMNQCRSSKRFFGVVKKPVRELLPIKPVSTISIEPWWIIHVGYVTEDDIKMVTESEKQLIDKIIDDGPRIAGEMDAKDVKSLYLKGLVYMDVPVDDSDYIIVPPLEGFVMNRVLGDYFETLLYKIFVSIDEHTTVAELASVLQIDLDSVKNAVSMYCRLGFARKKGCDAEANQYHPSWRGVLQSKPRRAKSEAVEDFMNALNTDLDKDGTIVEGSAPSSDSGGTEEHVPTVLSPSPHAKRIGFLFDSTLTAFLMMGNLSHGLKSHAVTMFEVGKLSDESLDSFLVELEKVGEVGEGEAKRYFEHAITLRNTILFLRNNPQVALQHFSFESEEGQSGAASPKGLGLDLIRCESLQNLDNETCARLLNKNYELLVSMAPLSNEIKPITSHVPPNLGPACPEVNSMWFKMFVYSVTNQGPPSLLLVKGTRLRILPKIFMSYDRLLVTTWGHDPGTVPISSALITLNEALCHSAVLIQGQSSESRDVVYVPFPFDEESNEGADENDLAFHLKDHPSVQTLAKKIDLRHSCGYLTMVYLKKLTVVGPILYPPYPYKWVPTISDRFREPISSVASDSSDIFGSPLRSSKYRSSPSPSVDGTDAIQHQDSAESSQGSQGDLSNSNPEQSGSKDEQPFNPDDWTLLDCNFGIPLFNTALNRSVCSRIAKFSLCTSESLEQLTHSNQELCNQLLNFINDYQVYPQCSDGRSTLILPVKKEGCLPDPPFPIQNVLFADGEISVWDGK